MKFIITRMLFCIFLFTLMWFTSSLAVSLSDKAVEELRKEGKLEEWVERANQARAKGVWQPNPNPPLLKAGKSAPAVAESLRAIVLLVDFSDKVHSKDSSEFSSLLFSQGTFPTGSMKDFYKENSYQQFVLNGAVYGWIRAPQTYAYYTYGASGLDGYPHNAQRLVEDVVSLANPHVNFANYDKNGDGYVDALFVVHAGPGAEQTHSYDDIWSHSWSTGFNILVDGVWVSRYTIEPEKMQSGELVHVGVFCHEFGHTLGLQDLYDTDNSSEGLGHWSLMASGSWNNDGKTPGHIDAWSKAELGWIEIDTMTSNQTNVEILQIETSPKAYRLWTNGGTGLEYFLVENRQKTGFDKYLDGEGLLIYHVDESVSNNNKEWYPGYTIYGHYQIALEQADNNFNLEKGENTGDAGDPFPGYWNIIAFDDTTTPSSRDYSDNKTQVAVWNISTSDSVMHANLDVSWSRPGLYLDSFTLNDSPPGGNGNGKIEVGETVKVYFTIRNVWLPITGTTVTGRFDTPGITFSDSTSYLGTIGTDSSVNNNSDLIQFVVDPGFTGKPVVFTLHVTGNTTFGSYTVNLNQEFWAGNREILIVDDDNGSAQDYRSYYTSALDSLNNIYDTCTAQASPSFSFNKYKYLIWYTGDHKTNLFSKAQVESLMSFLDNGGGLFLTSQDAVEVLSNSYDPGDTLFLKNYLHVGYDGNCGRLMVVGQTGDEVGDNLHVVPNYAVSNQTSQDNLVPDPEADIVLSYTMSNSSGWWTPTDSVAGTKFQNRGFKVVVFGFGFESMRTDGGLFHGEYCSKPHLVMQKVLNWLSGSSEVSDWGDESASLPKAFELYQNYPNPFNSATSIHYTVGSKQTKAVDSGQWTVGSSPHHVSLKIYNILGQLVKTLVNEEKLEGNYSVVWDGKDQSENEVSSGIYFYQLKTGEYAEVKKMLMLK